ncbi:MAG: phenylacetate--CoA ligase family protein [candidate division Zixibacteria bacterium]|nr:phenylacetate--CoA ligase family protein [candidate division Zixibacteria bacterium]
MDIHGKLVRHLFYPLWLRREHQYGILSRIAPIAALADLTPAALAERQFELLKQIVSHAGRHSPFYQRRFAEAGFSPEKLTSPDDLKKLPILAKEEINRHREDMVVPAYRERGDLQLSHTGGSSGIPMKFYRNRECLLYRRALDHYLDHQIGFEIGDKLALLWGSSADFLQPTARKRVLFDHIFWRRICYVPLWVEEEPMLDFTKSLHRFAPRMLKTYPSLAHFYCRFLIERNITPPQIPIITVTAEQMYDFQRELIVKTFGGELFDKYGSREIGSAAIECRQHDGLHLRTDSLYLEIEPVSDFPVEGVGRQIYTDLRNYAMPLIRYDVGDLAALDNTPCACGQPFPRLKNIQGRAFDIVYRRDGTPIIGIELIGAVTHAGLPNQAQVQQDVPGKVIVNIVDLETVPREKLEYIRNRLMTILGDDGRVDFCSVDYIERDKSGKYRYVLSNVKK